MHDFIRQAERKKELATSLHFYFQYHISSSTVIERRNSQSTRRNVYQLLNTLFVGCKTLLKRLRTLFNEYEFIASTLQALCDILRFNYWLFEASSFLTKEPNLFSIRLRNWLIVNRLTRAGKCRRFAKLPIREFRNYIDNFDDANNINQVSPSGEEIHVREFIFQAKFVRSNAWHPRYFTFRKIISVRWTRNVFNQPACLLAC